MKKPALIVVVAAAVIVAAAAYVVLRPRNQFANVRALVSALESEGIECEELNVSAPDPTPDIVDFGSCQMNGKTVNLHVYKSGDAVARHIEGNVSAREIGNPNYFTSLVAGDNWVVDSYSEETTEQIRRAIGGEIH